MVSNVQNGKKFIQISASTIARNWFPCVDNFSVKCPWNITFVFPSHYDGTEIHLISTGKIISSRNFENKKALMFYQKIPLSAANITFILGTFEKQEVVPSNQRFAFFPLGKSSKLASTLESLGKIFDYYNWFLNNQFPFQCFFIVFAFEIPKPVQSGNLVILE